MMDAVRFIDCLDVIFEPLYWIHGFMILACA